jgi:hypothetical protein
VKTKEELEEVKRSLILTQKKGLAEGLVIYALLFYLEGISSS